jgi:hypothetical protein
VSAITPTLVRTLRKIQIGAPLKGAEWGAMRRSLSLGLVVIDSAAGLSLRRVTSAGELVAAAFDAGVQSVPVNRRGRRVRARR